MRLMQRSGLATVAIGRRATTPQAASSCGNSSGVAASNTDHCGRGCCADQVRCRNPPFPNASVKAAPVNVPAPHGRSHGCRRSCSRWSPFTENCCRCLAFVLQLAMATARRRRPFSAPPRPAETPLCSPPISCSSVHLSVRLRLLPLSLPHANPLTREVGEGAKGPPPRRPRSARNTTDATGLVGIPLPTVGPSAALSPVSLTRSRRPPPPLPSLVLRTPPSII